MKPCLRPLALVLLAVCATGADGVAIFNNWNTGGVANGPSAPTLFTLPTPYLITYVSDYHWNNGRGQRTGTIALRASDGRLYGPWPATTTGGQGGAPNVNWIVQPNVVIPAGTYTVLDSDPASWSQNPQSRGQGFSEVRGQSRAGTATPVPTPILTSSTTTAQPTGERGGPEDVQDARQATIGSAGGAITLSDGAAVSVRGGLSAGSRLVFKRLGKDAVFAGTGVSTYDLSADRYPSELVLSFPVAKGLAARYLAIFNYTPGATGDVDGEAVPFTYDAAAGRATITVRPGRVAGRDPDPPPAITRTRYVVAQAPPAPSNSQGRIVPMPYYQQDGKGCYASCLKMMQRAYRTEGRDQVFDYMMPLGYDENTGPAGVSYWIYKIKMQLTRASGKSVTTGAYYFISSALNNLVERIDQGIPVMVGRLGHSIVVNGYRKSPGQTDPATYQWLVQDPSGDHDLNYWTNATFVTQNTMVFEDWPLEPPPTVHALQTVGLPMTRATGDMTFYVLNTLTRTEGPVTSLAFNIFKSPVGYGWKTKGQIALDIPADATRLQLKLPVWNADPANSAPLHINAMVFPKDKKGKLFMESWPVNVGAGGRADVLKSIPMSAFASDAGPNYRVQLDLIGPGNRNLDGFWLDFIYTPGFGLTATAVQASHTATLKLTGAVPAGGSCVWDFGDGGKQTTRTPDTTHTYQIAAPAANGSASRPGAGTTFGEDAITASQFNVTVEVRDPQGKLLGTASAPVAFNSLKSVSVGK